VSFLTQYRATVVHCSVVNYYAGLNMMTVAVRPIAVIRM
jgi:hypothetical protein